MQRSLIAEAKQRLPLPDLLRSYGFNPPQRGEGNMPSPLVKDGHRQKTPSFSIFQRDRQWHWKDRSGGGESGGDEITFIEQFDGVTRKEAIKRYFEKAALKAITPTSSSARVNSPAPNGQSFDWLACVRGFTDEHAAKLAEWRGYSLPFIKWLVKQRLIGIYDGHFAFPVHDERGNVIAAHVRGEKWYFYPKGQGIRPLIIGNVAEAKRCFVFESQWDAFALMDRLGWHQQELPKWAVLTTRGASNGRLAKGIPQKCEIYAVPQNDPAGRKWLHCVATSRKKDRAIFVAEVNQKFNDLNDWFRAETNYNAMEWLDDARTRTAKTPDGPGVGA